MANKCGTYGKHIFIAYIIYSILNFFPFKIKYIAIPIFITVAGIVCPITLPYNLLDIIKTKKTEIKTVITEVTNDIKTLFLYS